MTLRKKTLIAISITLLVVIVILYSVTRSIINTGFASVEKESLGGFGQIENRYAIRNVERVTDALRARYANLSVKVFDWAQWDDSYKFAADHNTAFIESNLNAEALAGLKINMLAIFDKNKKIVWKMTIDIETGEEVEMPPGLSAYLEPACRLFTNEEPQKDIAGIVMLPEGPVLVAARPIVTSEGKGPSRGTIVFTRNFDSAEIASLAEVTHLTLQCGNVGADSGKPEFAAVAPLVTSRDTIVVSIQNDDLIAGFTMIRDIEGKPALMLRVEMPRDIHRQGMTTLKAINSTGRSTLIAMLVSIIGAGILLIFIVMTVMERSILSRLTRLSGSTSDIGKRGNFASRVDAAGSDEIAVLGTSINSMLMSLGATHAQIEERNAEMRLLMNTVPAGLLTLDENLIINNEFSRSVTLILGHSEIAGKKLEEVLGLTGARAKEGATLAEFLDFFRMGILSEKDAAGLNPADELNYASTAGDARLRLRFYCVNRGENLPLHILTVIEDITQQKALEEKAQRSERENMQLKAIAENPDLFREFLIETQKIITNVTSRSETLHAGRNDLPLVHEIFRGVHTVKGVSGSFGLFAVSDLSGRLETHLSPLRETGDVDAESVEYVKTTLTNLQNVFRDVVDNAKRFLGEDFDRGGSIVLHVPLEKMKAEIDEIRGMAVEEELKNRIVAGIKSEFIRRLMLLKCVPAGRGLARAVKIIPGLAERLGRQVVFSFDGQDTLIDPEVAAELNGPLVHLLRNALDHGIELPDERIAAGKPGVARVVLTIKRTTEGLQVSVADDGRGLDVEKIRVVAVERGILTQEMALAMPENDVQKLIFMPGFSTADQITDVSGRGVGMDAVLDSVEKKLRGSVRIESARGTGTRIILEIPESATAPACRI